MKKLIFAMICLVCVISANAQDREEKDYKLVTPAITAETQIGALTSTQMPT